MLENFKFANINAKVKGMYSSFLKKEDYEELVKQQTIKEAIILLKNKMKVTRYIDYNAKRREIEKELYKILLVDIRKIYHLLDKKSKEFLESYLEKQKLKYNTKEIIQDDEEKLENEFYKEYFKQIYSKAEKFKDKALIDIIGKQIDLYNIIWTFRAKKYYTSQINSWENFEIPVHYKLSKEVLTKLNQGQEPPDDIIEKTIYHEFTLEEDKIEKEIQNYLYRLYINNFKTKSFSLTMVITYIELRQIQIKNIITIIEGIRYHIDNQKILKKLIIE